jgi:hypothetical protein
MKSAYCTSALLFLTVASSVVLVGEEYGNVGTAGCVVVPTSDIFQKADEGDVSAIGQYFALGEDLNIFHPLSGRTLLMEAALHKNGGVVEVLLQMSTQQFPGYEKAVRVDMTDRLGKTALHYAASVDRSTGMPEYIMHLLIEAGANPNVADNAGKTPLYYGIEANQSHTLYVLLQEGADPEAKLIRFDGEMISAYEYAEKRGHKNFACRELLAYRDRNALQRATDAMAHFTFEALEVTPVLGNYAHLIYTMGIKTIYEDVVSHIGYYTAPVVSVVTTAAVGVLSYASYKQNQQGMLLPL